MDFAGVGFSEIVVILVIAMLAVGPRRLPEIARKMGQMANKFRMTAAELTRSVTAEVEEERSEMSAAGREMKDTVNQAVREAAEEEEENYRSGN